MKRNHGKKNNRKKSQLASANQRLVNFQKNSPQKFKLVFDHYQQGQRELQVGAISEAKISFENALRFYPEYIPALNNIAVIYGLKGNYREAFLYVKKVIKLDEHEVFALIQGAIFLYRLQREKEAEVFADKAFVSFEQREGIDPYHDYDMLQKLAEMLSVLQLDDKLSRLYMTKKAQLAPISIYRSALALSNQELYEEACTAFTYITDASLKEKSMYLHTSLELFLQENLSVPKFYAEEESGFEQLMAIRALFIGDEQQKHASLSYLKETKTKWTVDVVKQSLLSEKLKDWLKKSLLSILADWGEAEKPVPILIDGELQHISLQPIEVSLNEEMTILFGEAKMNIAKGKVAESISTLKIVHEAVPTYIPVYLELANAYVALRDFTKAEIYLKEALKITPLASVFLGFAKFYKTTGELVKSLENLMNFDTRQLETAAEVYEAIELKVELTNEQLGSEKALTVFFDEKEKYKSVLADWEVFEDKLKPILESEVTEDSTEETEDEISQLEKYTKDKLVAIAKSNNLRGYSKFNKKDLIQFLKIELFDKELLKL
ncbi:tetratricopeptide repeat protein [Anaerobacillus sp. CMMVII]|uniref:hypothetical protein n=1 Tax=Anaerobacillus sp. CMMVII TaxID=2755588 RepID=UPI0021B6F16E|nr:hypothetical protein [Anaerobacillus sp. CMMVII]MCT8140483.1 tetratricopeptide repeat protein [Anaerobacillus sp. CMMVII]